MGRFIIDNYVNINSGNIPLPYLFKQQTYYYESFILLNI